MQNTPCEKGLKEQNMVQNSTRTPGSHLHKKLQRHVWAEEGKELKELPQRVIVQTTVAFAGPARRKDKRWGWFRRLSDEGAWPSHAHRLSVAFVSCFLFFFVSLSFFFSYLCLSFSFLYLSFSPFYFCLSGFQSLSFSWSHEIWCVYRNTWQISDYIADITVLLLTSFKWHCKKITCRFWNKCRWNLVSDYSEEYITRFRREGRGIHKMAYRD